MKDFYQKYINEKHSFDKITMLGIFSLIIVIAGTIGFIYEVIFYYFNFGMKDIYWRWKFSSMDKYLCNRSYFNIFFNI